MAPARKKPDSAPLPASSKNGAKYRQHKCTHCPYLTNSKRSVRTHTALCHTTAKKFNCPHCTYSSDGKQHLNEHAKLHDNTQTPSDPSEDDDFKPNVHGNDDDNMTSEPDSDEEQRSPKKKTTKRKIENDESEESEGEDSDDERKKKKSKKNRRPCRIKVIDDDVDDSDGLEVDDDDDEYDVESESKERKQVEKRLSRIEAEGGTRVEERAASLNRHKEDIRKYFEDNYKSSNTGGGGAELNDDDDDALDDISQRGLRPSRKDPNLWMVECTRIGEEKSVALELMRKMIEHEQKGEPLQIKSVIVKEGLKGIIYIEAFKQSHVAQAIEDVSALDQLSITMVQINEMVEVLRVIKDTPTLKQGMYVRMKRTMYKDDLAQTAEGVEPTPDELKTFQVTSDDLEGEWETMPVLEAAQSFAHEDLVEVGEGELVDNLMGKIIRGHDPCLPGCTFETPGCKKIFYKIITPPEHEDLKEPLTLSGGDEMKRRRFKQGDRVRVLDGEHEGDNGLVVRVERNALVVLSDLSKHEMKVRRRECELCADVPVVVDSLGQFQLHDLVEIDVDKTAGVIVRVEKESLEVLSQYGRVIPRVHPQNIQKKLSRLTNTDSQQNPMQVKDVVKVVDGRMATNSGREEAKQGEIIHILAHHVFLHSRKHAENGGIFVARAKHVLLVGANGGDTSNDLPQMDHSYTPPPGLSFQQPTPPAVDDVLYNPLISVMVAKQELSRYSSDDGYPKAATAVVGKTTPLSPRALYAALAAPPPTPAVVIKKERISPPPETAASKGVRISALDDRPMVGVPTDFIVAVPNDDKVELKVVIRDLEGHTIVHTLVQTSPTECTVKYTPARTGEHEISLFVVQLVTGSGGEEPAATATVVARLPPARLDVHSTGMRLGGGAVKIKIEKEEGGAPDAPTGVEDRSIVVGSEDDASSLSTAHTPSLVGLHAVNAVEKGVEGCDASKVKCTGDGLSEATVGKSADFAIDTKEAEVGGGLHVDQSASLAAPLETSGAGIAENGEETIKEGENELIVRKEESVESEAEQRERDQKTISELSALVAQQKQQIDHLTAPADHSAALDDHSAAPVGVPSLLLLPRSSLTSTIFSNLVQDHDHIKTLAAGLVQAPKIEQDSKAMVAKMVTVIEEPTVQPPPAENYDDFMIQFNRLKHTPKAFGKYFLSIPPSSHLDIFDNLIKYDHIKTIVAGLTEYANEDGVDRSPISASLYSVCTLPRFDLSVMLMTDDDIAKASALIDLLPVTEETKLIRACFQ